MIFARSAWRAPPLESRMFIDLPLAASARLSEEALARTILAMGRATFFEDLLAFIRSRVYFDSALVLRYRPGRRPEILCDALEHPSGRNSAALRAARACRLNPIYRRAMETKRDSVFRLKDTFGDDFPRSAYSLSYGKDVSAADEVDIVVILGPEAVCAVRIERPAGHEAFSRWDLQDLKLWLPTVAALLRRHWQSAGQEGRKRGEGPEAGQSEAPLGGFATAVLTPRERDVVKRLLRGQSPARMAERLGISVATVRVHRRNIYRKLGVCSLAELFALALRGHVSKSGADGTNEVGRDAARGQIQRLDNP